MIRVSLGHLSWCVEWYLAVRYGTQFAWSDPLWSWTLRKACFPSGYGERHGLLLMPSQTDAHVDLGRPLVSRTRCRIFEMVPCDTPVVLNIAPWERSRLDNRTTSSRITGQILFGMISTLVWDGSFYTTTAHSWIRSVQMRHIAFGPIGEIGTLEKKDWSRECKGDYRT